MHDTQQKRTMSCDRRSVIGRIGFARARNASALLFVILIGVSLATHLGTGVYSSLGISWISEVCPAGILQSLASGNAKSSQLVVGALISVGLIVLFGKAFCAWGCPIPLIRGFFSKKHATDFSGKVENACLDRGNPLPKIGGVRDGVHIDSRHIILIGTVLAAIVFAFPVFCLICPVGLTAATIICYWHLIQFNDVTVGLVVFPLLVVLEVVGVRKKWCSWVCPIAACTSLISTSNKTIRPSVSREQCLRSHGADCRKCVQSCPERLDPHSEMIPDCTKCGVCIEACPAHAISMKFLRTASDYDE